MPEEFFSWTIGGAQGSGVDSAANLFARALAAGNLHVFGKREYYSNIMGAHSYFQLRVGARPPHSHVDYCHLLTTFDAESVARHAFDVLKGGGIIYDPKLVSTEIKRIAPLEREIIEYATRRVGELNHPATVEGCLKVAEAGGVRLYPIPYADLLQKLKAEFPDTDARTLNRMTNTMAVAASLALVGYEMSYLEGALSDVFRGKKSVVGMNVRGAQIAYAYVEEHYLDFPYKLKPIAARPGKTIYVNGNQAISIGKILGGCTFQTYYPITPASDESVFLEDRENFPLKGAGGNGPGMPAGDSKQGAMLVVQTEDEIAAITMATGAALAGARSATATSGPGFSLMAEGLGWAGHNEVPVVITLYQRGGPATGLPTRHEQGDLRFAIFAAHGEFPRIVYSSGDLETAFYDSAYVFNLAEKYQMPVIHILDKALANSNQTMPYWDFSKVKIDRGKLMDAVPAGSNGEAFKRFQITDDGISPRIRLGTPGAVTWNTGDEHDEIGHITEDPDNRNRMMEKRMKKLEVAAGEIPREQKMWVSGDPKAKIGVLTWGSCKGAVRDAVDTLRQEGVKIKMVEARLMWPLPAAELEEELGGCKTLVAVEQNYSAQFAGLVTQYAGLKWDCEIVKYNGRPMSYNEVLDALRAIAATRGGQKIPNRVVLHRGH